MLNKSQFLKRVMGKAFHTSGKDVETSHVSLLAIIGVFASIVFILGGIPAVVHFHEKAGVVTILTIGIIAAFCFLYWMLFEGYYAVYCDQCKKTDNLELQVKELQNTIDGRAKKRVVSEQLAAFMREGMDLKELCVKENELPGKQVKSWVDRTEEFLAREFGPGYIPRFRNEAGLPMVGLGPMPSQEHFKLWGYIHVRVCRLEQFYGELIATPTV